MHIVQPSESLAVAVEKGRHAIRLEVGRRYVMHDVEVASGRDAGVFASVEPPPQKPAPFDAACAPARLLVPFIGGLGDALSLLPVLRSVRQAHPKITIDVATTPGPAEVFALSRAVDGLLPHPLTIEDWCRYDAYADLEAVRRTRLEPGRALPEVFAAALGLDPPELVFDLTIPRASDGVQPAQDETAPPLVAVAAGEGRSLRAYPHAMTAELIERLASSGVACVLLGYADPSRPIREHPPLVTDMRGHTSSVLELAVWMREMDAVVAVDSFMMHLAGALGRPAVSLFAPTAAAHAAPYETVASLASGTYCAPCHATGTSCPKGYARCIAWDDAAVAPAAVLQAIHAALTPRLRHAHFLENVRKSPPAA